MVEVERVKKRLSLLRETTGLLSDTVPKSEGEYASADRTTKDATERRLQIISEAELDIVKTLYKDLGRRVVGDEESLLRAMEDMLGKKVTEAVRRRRRLRNRLVHVYLDVDRTEVYQQASNLTDVEEFERTAARLVEP